MTARRFSNRIIFNVLKAHLPAVLLYLTSTTSLLFGIGAQLVGFIVLARFMGAEQFGQLMAITAGTVVASSITGLGTEEVMLRRCAREPSLYPKLLGHSLIVILTSGLFFTFLTVVGLQMLVQVAQSNLRNLETLTIFAFSNVVLARCIILTEFIFIARQRIMYANIVVSGFAAMRMSAAVIGSFVFEVDRIEAWALWHGGIHILGTVFCIAALRKYGAPDWCVLRDEIRRGAFLATQQLVTSLRRNIDRLALTAVAPAITVGNYAVASNVVQYSFVTINSFSRLVYPKFAIAGQNGPPATFQLAIKYLVVIVGLGITDSIGLFVIAPLLPRLFGGEFNASIYYLMILCWLPIIVAIHNVAYDALGGAEKHGIRAFLSNVAGFFGIGLIGSLTYVYGVSGAFAGIFVSDILICGIMWLCLIVLGQRDQKTLP